MSNSEEFGFHLLAASAGPLVITKYRIKSPDSAAAVDPGDNLLFGQVKVGRVAVVANRERIDTTLPWFFPEQRLEADWDDITTTVMSFPRDTAVRMARAELGSDTAQLSFIGTTPIDPSRGRQWARFVEYTYSALLSASSPLDAPMVRGAAFDHLVALMLQTFPNSVIDTEHDQSRPTVTPTSVQRAIVFIEQNAHLPITVEDIARESRLSIRALQYAFRRYHGTTPAAYLRRARLDGAHYELKDADPTGGAKVADIAVRWGFANAGRFATHYREAYGVLPKQTLDS